MSLDDVVALLVVCALATYLVFSILFPERF